MTLALHLGRIGPVQRLSMGSRRENLIGERSQAVTRVRTSLIGGRSLGSSGVESTVR